VTAVRAYGTTHGVGEGEEGRGSVEFTSPTMPGKYAPDGKVFHKQAKRVKLYGAGVINGELMDRKLDNVRSDKNIVEIKWFEKHQVTY
jgi:hypothetical protein